MRGSKASIVRLKHVSVRSRVGFDRDLMFIVLLISLLMATGIWSVANAGSLYKCVGTDGVPAYVSVRINGAKCSAIPFVADSDAGVRGRDRVDNPAGLPRSSTARRTSTAFTPPNDSLVHSAGARDSLQLKDFGDPNAGDVLGKILKPNSGFRYVQIGDSHTAGDFLVDRLRTKLQERLGDGGAGWVTPMTVPGQRQAGISFQHNGWQLLSSRKSGPDEYPFGGFIARVVSNHAELTLSTKHDDFPQDVIVLLRQGRNDAALTLTDSAGQRLQLRSPETDRRWHQLRFRAQLPFKVVADHSPETEIGGWWLSVSELGATASAVGINGSQLSQWDRWRNGWMEDLEPGKPDLIGVAYGTNEAFNDSLDLDLMRISLEHAVDGLRQRYPGAAVMILGAPESLSVLSGDCGTRSPSLNAVQRIQKEVATNRKTLYWDWQNSMGGACSMKRWIDDGFARKDGVHFTSAGYARLGDTMYHGLVSLAGRPNSTSISDQ